MDTANTWHRLSAVLKYYDEYKYVDAPWAVDMETMLITCPGDQYVTKSAAGCLVGSAEQSFLHLLRTGVLEDGDYIAVTPCFRHTDALERSDELHRAYFMKAELIHASHEPIPASYGTRLAAQARDCFLHLAPAALADKAHSALRMVHTESGYDLELSGIEIGSYGVRRYEDLWWAYGTALAEPRFTQALRHLHAHG